MRAAITLAFASLILTACDAEPKVGQMLELTPEAEARFNEAAKADKVKRAKRPPLEDVLPIRQSRLPGD